MDRAFLPPLSPLSPPPRVGQDEARGGGRGHLAAEFGELTGITALVQQGQGTERTRRSVKGADLDFTNNTI